MNRRRFIAGTCAIAVALGSVQRTSADATPSATAWGSAAPLPVGRSEFAATVLDGKIYVAGGFGSESLFDRFDPITDRWESLADLPEPRHHLSLVAYDGGVYLAGGHNQSANSATDTFWRFHVESGGWEVLEPLPQGPRGALGAAVIDGSIYVAGGSSSDLGGPATANLARYDIGSSTWSLLAPMPTAREHLGVAAVGGKIVAIGGRNGSYETHALLSATEVYDPVSESWSVGAELPVPRAGLGVSTYGNSVIIIGGERFSDDEGNSIAEAFASVDAYEVAINRWSELIDLPVARHGMAAAQVDGVLYGIGGSTEAGQVANVDRVDTLVLA